MTGRRSDQFRWWLIFAAIMALVVSAATSACGSYLFRSRHRMVICSCPVPGPVTDVNSNAQIAWTPNSRWLLAITDHQMRAFDTRPTGPAPSPSTDEQLLHLTMAWVPG